MEKKTNSILEGLVSNNSAMVDKFYSIYEVKLIPTSNSYEARVSSLLVKESERESVIALQTKPYLDLIEVKHTEFKEIKQREFKYGVGYVSYTVNSEHNKEIIEQMIEMAKDIVNNEMNRFETLNESLNLMIDNLKN